MRSGDPMNDRNPSPPDDARDRPVGGRPSWRNGIEPVWCPGCGHHAALKALDAALVKAGASPSSTCWVSGIGCACRMPCFLDGYAFHGAHGRALPVATGIKLANPALRVIVTMGDGDALSIGAGHFPHACRRNPGVTCLVLDNGVFGMTKGQPSPTAPRGAASKIAPGGVFESPLDPVALALVSGATFACRASAANGADMTGLLSAALAHRGFSLVHVLSPCPTFNRELTFESLRRSVRTLPGPAGLPDRAQAVAAALERDPVRTGLFWREERPTLEAAAGARGPAEAIPLEDLLARYE
jgi:2-oxoglutarate ferredoxin oxidoreductase subunit beta